MCSTKDWNRLSSKISDFDGVGAFWLLWLLCLDVGTAKEASMGVMKALGSAMGDMIDDETEASDVKSDGEICEGHSDICGDDCSEASSDMGESSFWPE